MAKAGAGGALVGGVLPMAIIALSHSTSAVMSPLEAEDSTPKALTTIANAAAITASVAVVLHRTVMQCR